MFAGAFTAASPRVLRNPPNELLAAMSGVGGAIFISYTVGISQLVRQIQRSSDSENLLGFLTGLSICGIFGVGLALSLIAALPLFAYDDSRIRHLNRDD